MNRGARWSGQAALLVPILVWISGAALSHAAGPGEDAARVLRVGPERALRTPSMAAAAARDGDIVEIDPADYAGDVAVWRNHRLTLRAASGRARLLSGGASAEDRAIWVIKGDDAVVENIEFHDARSAHRNGAGIRLEGTNLTVRHCLFRHNENGILTGGNPASQVLVEHTEFDGNGHGDGQSHNLYIGAIAKFSMRFSYSHHARVGHQLKSRAVENHILYNRMSDELDGTSSYLIDLPSGGVAHVHGNILQQGEMTDNSTLVSFGAEGLAHPRNKLHMAHNSLVNLRRRGCRLLYVNPGAETAVVFNNVFSGCARIDGLIQQAGNVTLDEAQFQAAANFDYRPRAKAAAIDAGLPASELAAAGIPYPEHEYRHRSRSGPRPIQGAPDAGAFEFID